MRGARDPVGGYGDVVAPGQMQGADGEVTRACHDTGSGSGAGAGVVLAIDGVANPVQRLGAPMLAYQLGELGGACLAGGEVGDAERGGRGDLAVSVTWRSVSHTGFHWRFSGVRAPRPTRQSCPPPLRPSGDRGVHPEENTDQLSAMPCVAVPGPAIHGSSVNSRRGSDTWQCNAVGDAEEN